MIKRKIKAFLATPKGKLTAAGAVMTASLLFLAVNFSGSTGGWFADTADLAALARDIDTAERQYAALVKRETVLSAASRDYKALLADAGDPAQVSPESVLRAAAEKAAEKAQLQLQSIGAAHQSSLTADLALYELDFSGVGDGSSIAELLLALNDAAPQVFFRKFEMRTGGRGPTPAGVSFSGTIGMLMKQSGGKR